MEVFKTNSLATTSGGEVTVPGNAVTSLQPLKVLGMMRKAVIVNLLISRLDFSTERWFDSTHLHKLTGGGSGRHASLSRGLDWG